MVESSDMGESITASASSSATSVTAAARTQSVTATIVTAKSDNIAT